MKIHTRSAMFAVIGSVLLTCTPAQADTYGDKVNALGPMAYWRLGEASGINANDEAGTYDGTYTNGVTLAQTGIVTTNTAVSCDGVNDYVEVAHDDAFLLDDGSVQLWFNATSISGTRGLLSKDSSGYDTGGHFTIYIESSVVKVRIQSTAADYYVQSSTISAGTWYHVVLTFGAGGLKLYLDGQEVDTDAYTGGLGTTSGGTGNHEPMAFGANVWTSGDLIITPVTDYHSGLVDEVVFFNYALTPTEVESLADAGWLFTNVTSASGLSGISNTYGLDWGDYDNDGHPDLYVTGVDALYKNDGDGTFSAGPSVSADDRAVHWGDYDNDGDLDIAATLNLYVSRNNGDNTFTLQSNAGIGLTSISNLGDFGWLDFNQDGALDMWAPNGSSPYAYMYQGNGDGTFTAIDADTIGLSADINGESTVVTDYDGDGWTDILYRAATVYLWSNDGDGTFTDRTGTAGVSLTGTGGGYNGTAFGDYDNDGDLDLYGGQPGSNKLYSNDGDGTFTDVTGTAGVGGTSSTTRGVAWGDCDNDGDLDLYVAHSNAANELFENNGDGTFTEVAAAHGVDDGSASYGAMWEDYDLDGDLDLFLGNDSSGSKLYRNNTDDTNYLKVRVVGGGACRTNAAATGVRVELYDATNTTYLAQREIGVASSYGSSEPKWAHFGGVDPAVTYTVRVHFHSGLVSTGVVPGSVSTVIGSTTINQMLTVQESPAPSSFTDVSAATGFDVATGAGSEASGLHWGDLDDDGYLDVVVTGSVSSKVMLSDGSAFFAANLVGAAGRQGALLDIDDDDDLDYWHNDESLYENDGAGLLSDIGALGFTDPSNNENVAVADVNADGWCDLVMFSGNTGNWIGHHQGDDPPTLVGTDDVSYGLNDAGDFGNGDFCSAGDVNNDGYLDFFYHYGTGKLFLSDGDGTYTENASGISVVTGNSDKMGSAWSDYDNDGDLDLYVPRYANGSTGYLWRNDGGTFTDVTGTAGVTNISGQRSACWGDYDNDGDLDLYVVTVSGNANVLYDNQGDGTFVAACENTAAAGDGHDAVFVDYDNDGDLDLAITQAAADNTLLRNDLDDTNYLKVRVLGRGGGGTNKAAIGVRVDLYAADATTFLARREIGVARGFGGIEPMWVHFGGVDPAQTYVVKVHFVSGVPETTVVPNTVSTTIGATVISQMLTVEDTSFRIIRWQEVAPN